jgi:hypothetical protein
MKRQMFLFVAAALLLPACGGTNRPEGVVERWLVSLNQGKAGEPGNYAPEALSQQILPNWQSRDPGELDVIEVGRGETGGGPTYFVPFRVKRLDGHEMTGTAEVVTPLHGPWQVERLLPAVGTLPVPSRGGKRIGDASWAAWLGGVAIAVFLILLSVLVMSTVGREARVSS